MARTKPYRLRLGILDLILLLLTAGAWFVVMLVRELYMRIPQYSFGLACLDLFLIVITGGIWLFPMLVRELLRK